MNSRSVIASIVTYNPDVLRLRENIDAIAPQVGKVIIYDNGSDNITDIIDGIPEQCLILEPDNKDNKGIAYALNRCFEYAETNGYQWVLTLDQDSVCPPNIVKEYSRYFDDSSIGMLSPVIIDRNCGCLEEPESDGITDLDICITSASLLRVDVWKLVHGFWEDLFIDMVDTDICWSIKEYGLRIVRVNSVRLLHELGHSRLKSFRGSNVAVFNHSPQRYYYIIRNGFLVGRKHHRLYQCMRWNLKRIFLTIRYESVRWQKLKMVAMGIIDGVRGISGPIRSRVQY